MRKRPISRGLALAVKAAGNKTKLAKLLHRSRNAVSIWYRVPDHLVLKVEKLTGVSRYELRPDIFGEESGTQASQESGRT